MKEAQSDQGGTPPNETIISLADQAQSSSRASGNTIAAHPEETQGESATYYCLGILNIPGTIDVPLHAQDPRGTNTDDENHRRTVANIGQRIEDGSPHQTSNNQARVPREVREAFVKYLRRRYLLPACFAIVPIMVCIYALSSGYGEFYAYLLGFITWIAQLLVAFAVYSALLKRFKYENWTDLSEILNNRRITQVAAHQLPVTSHPSALPPRYSSCESTYTLPPYTEYDTSLGFDTEKGPATNVEPAQRQ